MTVINNVLYVISGCDVTFEDTHGVIQSPGYGVSNTKYPNIVNCKWTINSKKALRLTFKDPFRLHPEDSLKVSFHFAVSNDILGL